LAVLLVSHTAARAQTLAAASSLPIGSALTFVSDETVNARVRPGSEFRAHLRDPLEVANTLVATAGTPARIVVTSKENAKDGTVAYHIAIIGFSLGLAGSLPVRPDAPVVASITTGMIIPATTLAIVGLDGGRVRVAVPLPFNLSNEPPASAYTPAPLRTASPVLNTRRRPGRSPRPSPAPSDSAPPSPTATPTPAPTGSPPAPTPTPTPT
jgi:hypothetical protein